jgi:hypothetical protein
VVVAGVVIVGGLLGLGKLLGGRGLGLGVQVLDLGLTEDAGAGLVGATMTLQSRVEAYIQVLLEGDL